MGVFLCFLFKWVPPSPGWVGASAGIHQTKVQHNQQIKTVKKNEPDVLLKILFCILFRFLNPSPKGPDTTPPPKQSTVMVGSVWCVWGQTAHEPHTCLWRSWPCAASCLFAGGPPRPVVAAHGGAAPHRAVQGSRPVGPGAVSLHGCPDLRWRYGGCAKKPVAAKFW